MLVGHTFALFTHGLAWVALLMCAIEQLAAIGWKTNASGHSKEQEENVAEPNMEYIDDEALAREDQAPGTENSSTVSQLHHEALTNQNSSPSV